MSRPDVLAGPRMYATYTVLTLLALVLGSPWFAWQAIRHRKYIGSLGQRLGRLPADINPTRQPSIWMHAVSVGEVLAARALAAGLRRRYPRLRLLVSTTTATGQQLARCRLPEADAVFYFPLDLPWVVRRVVDRLAPALFVSVETEIWPWVLRECRARGARTVLVNGRISDRSFPRYRALRAVFARVLDAVDRCCMQSETAAQRIVAIGADPSRVIVTGSLKFDVLDAPDALAGAATTGGEDVLRFFRVPASRLVLVAASTLRGEDGPALDAFQHVRHDHPGALLILAPRHPERFDEVERTARETGLHVSRRTALPIDADPPCDVVVLDTIGELARVFDVATLVFVGGSLVDAGGHNILEPAVHGKPIVFGPSMHNFAEIAREFLAAGAAVQVRSRTELSAAVAELASDPSRRERLGAAARAVVEANRGATRRTLEAIEQLLPPDEVRATSAGGIEQG